MPHMKLLSELRFFLKQLMSFQERSFLLPMLLQNENGGDPHCEDLTVIGRMYYLYSQAHPWPN